MEDDSLTRSAFLSYFLMAVLIDLICSAISSVAVLYSEIKRDSSHLSLRARFTIDSGKASRGILSSKSTSRFSTVLIPPIF